MIHAETNVTRPPEAVRIRASSTVFWNASNARKRLLPIECSTRQDERHVVGLGINGRDWNLTCSFRVAGPTANLRLHNRTLLLCV